MLLAWAWCRVRFTTATDLAFRLSPRASAGTVRLTLVDVAGRRVRTLVDGRMNPGRQTLRCNGADDLGRTLSSGVYFGKLQTIEGTQTQRLVLTHGGADALKRPLGRQAQLAGGPPDEVADRHPATFRLDLTRQMWKP